MNVGGVARAWGSVSSVSVVSERTWSVMVASRAQQVRAAARRRAVAAQEKRREQEKAREKRCADLGVAVSVALAQRDEAVEHFERQAGRALEALVGEGFSVAEAVQWSGTDGLSAREAQRLRKAAQTEDSVHGQREQVGVARVEVQGARPPVSSTGE